jgi:hypothetical protein
MDDVDSDLSSIYGSKKINSRVYMATRIILNPIQKVNTIRTCDTCKHYGPNMRCKIFGRISLVNASIYNATVYEAREEPYCGQEGRNWELNMSHEEEGQT